MHDQRLVILRHGKAEADSPTGFDADRPLAERGIRQAGWMGRELARAGFLHAPIFASPAERTWTTATIVAEALGTAPIRDERLFLTGTVGSAFELLAERAGDSHLIIVGHNPTVSLVASVLTHGVGPCAVSLRTGSAAVCAHDGRIEPGSADLLGVWRLTEK